MEDLIKLKTKLKLAIDLVQEVNLGFEELELGGHSIFRQGETCVVQAP